jgi:hypothetical protein
VTNALDEFFHCLEYSLFRTYHALPDARAQRQYLWDYQHTTLQLLGGLLEYTHPLQLYSEAPVRSFKDACCHYVYHALNSLLEYTIRLGGGQPDANLPLPPTTRTLFQEMIVGDLAALREYLEAIGASAGMIDIVSAPFEALPRAFSLTFYQVRYLIRLKQALLQHPLPGYDATGDVRVLWTLVAQNFNAPEFIAWFHHVMESRHIEFNRYKARLTTYPISSLIAWRPMDPSVREQLSAWLDVQLTTAPDASDSLRVATSPDFSASGEEDGLEDAEEDELDVDSPYSPDDLTLRNVTPQVFAVIANAARILHYVFWGKSGSHIAEMVARIATIHRPLRDRTVRRGLRDLATLRQAREILQSLIHFFDRQIEVQEEKFSR